jgi:hypothetical protein
MLAQALPGAEGLSGPLRPGSKALGITRRADGVEADGT